MTIQLQGCNLASLQEIPDYQALGIVFGGASGGYFASEFCNAKSKDLCVAAGVALGAYLGGQLGKYLKDEEDRAKHAAAMKEALNSGKSESWKNTNTNTSGSVKVIDSNVKKAPITTKISKSSVKELPPFDSLIGETYKSKNNINVRGGPSTDYEIVGNLEKNEVVMVVAKVEGSNWFFISQSGVARGFTYAPLLTEAPDELIAKSDIKIPKKDITEQEIFAEQICRTVEQSVTVSDVTKKEELVACQTAEGWKIQS